MNQRRKTTPNVILSQARKRRNKELRQKADELEASELGISVFELHRKRQKEAADYLIELAQEKKRQAAAALKAQQEARERSSSYGYGYGYRW